MDFKDLENSFRSILLSTTSEITRMVPENQNGPQPDLPYASYRILTINPVGRVQREFIDDNGDRQFYQHYSIPIRLTVYGYNAYTILNNICLSLCKETITRQMAKANIAYSTMTNIQLLPELVSAKWEERAEVVITVLSMATDEEAIGWIETIEGTGYFTSASGTTYSQDFTISKDP